MPAVPEFRRRAAVRRGLLVTLALLLAGAGGVWAWRAWDGSEAPGGGSSPPSALIIYCSGCRTSTELARDRLAALERNDAGLIRCPGCGAFAVQSPYRKGGQVMPAGAGPTRTPAGGG